MDDVLGMNDCQQTRRHERRQGFTLMEVLLVLALLAVLGAFAWPAIKKPFANRRLQAAADAVRVQWCQARGQAVRSGHTYAFRFAPGGDRFRLGPADDANSLALGSMTNNLPSGDTSGLPPQEPTPPAQEGTLPDGITFVADDSPVNDPDSQPYDPDNAGQSDSGGGWSDAILFFPDGTTTDAHVVITGQRGAGIRLTLRGITGSVTVGEPTSKE